MTMVDHRDDIDKWLKTVMRLAIIVPFRKREEHLSIFIPHIKSVCQDAQVYIIEQCDDKGFNRMKLFNIGFNEFNKEFDYMCLHDVDLISENADYSYCDSPCQIATEVEQFKWSVPYPKYMGGVTLIPNEAFKKINGGSNEYFFYGAEDDDLRRRFEAKSILVQSRKCRFKSLPHEPNIDHDMRMKNYYKLKEPIDWNDGLSNCKYEIVHCDDLEHYTLLQVKL